MPGVIKIVPLKTTYGEGFGVIAENTWAAFRAADAIEVEWEEPDYPPDSEAHDQGRLLTLAMSGDGDVMRDDGDVETAFADAPRERLDRGGISRFPICRTRRWSR